MTTEASAPLAIYVHWPFCVSKCPYCDFNSHVAETVDHDAWRRAYESELGRFAAETAGRTVTSVFFGGGTPSLMTPATVAAVIERIAALWPLAPDIEITAEANPSSAEAALFADFKAAGVNRLSLGVQTLDEEALKFLGRAHDVAEARRAAEIAAKTFARHSIDLICARPGQGAAAWRTELSAALALAGEHVSVYQLTIEPGTAFHRDRVKPANEDTAAAIYDVTQEVLEAAGLPQYEISNHARPGAECRHNLVYWRGGDYLGVGPGAHGRLTRDGVTDATTQIRLPGEWLAAVAAGTGGDHRRKAIAPDERRREVLLMGLRLAEGVPEATWHGAIDEDQAARLAEAGLIAFEGGRLRVLPAGRLMLDAILGRLVL